MISPVKVLAGDQAVGPASLSQLGVDQLCSCIGFVPGHKLLCSVGIKNLSLIFDIAGHRGEDCSDLKYVTESAFWDRLVPIITQLCLGHK
jgi:hypothetical protein